MTRDEAIQRLYRMGRPHVGIIDENTLADNKALSMAIEALNDMAERKDESQTELVNDSPILAKDLVDDEFNPYDEECMRCKHLKLQCEFVPSYCKYEPKDEPQTNADQHVQHVESVDLISRQDAIKAVEANAKWFNGDAIEDRCKRDAFISVIDDVLTELPSADRPIGKWIRHENPKLGICMKVLYECSVCGEWLGCEYFVRKSFCPNCGAYMKEDNNE